MKRGRKGNSTKGKIEGWLRSDVHIPYSVGVTFLVLAVLSVVFVFGASIASELAGNNNADYSVYPHELFSTAVFLVLFLLALIGISYIPHGVYSLYKRITGHRNDLNKVRRFAVERYALVYPFASFGLILLLFALLMWYQDLYPAQVFDRDAMMTISVITVVTIYGVIFGMTAHYFWIIFKCIKLAVKKQRKAYKRK